MYEITLDLTNRCPQSCVHCSSNAGPSGKIGLDAMGLLQLVDEAKALGVKQVNLGGGEPLFHFYFWNLVKYAREKGLQVKVYTCGVHVISYKSVYYGYGEDAVSSFPPEVVQKFKKYDITVVFNLLSMYATTHDACTGLTGSYYMTMQSIMECLMQKVPTQVNYVPGLPTQFSGDLEEIIKWARKVGIDRVNVLRLVAQGRASGMTQDTSAFEIGAPYNHLLDPSEQKTCAVLAPQIEKIVVTHDGYIIPCEAYKIRKKEFGNVANQTLRDALSSEPFTKIGKLAQDNGKAMTCCPIHHVGQHKV